MKPQPLITVSSVRDSAAFYCRLLGAQPGHGGDDFEQILIGSEMIMQIHRHGEDDHHPAIADESRMPGNGVILWFETDDFDATVTRLEELAVEPERGPLENPFAKQMEVWLRDPDGYQVVIAGPSAWPRQPLD